MVSPKSRATLKRKKKTSSSYGVMADCHVLIVVCLSCTMHAELRVLVAEVCTHEGVLYARKPDADHAETQFAAWEKIEQVYGKGRLERFNKGARREYILQILSEDRRVTDLLTPQTPGEEFNCHHIEEGSVMPSSDLARAVVSARSVLRWHSFIVSD